MIKNNFPKGWDEKRVRKVMAHHESQTDADATAEDAAAYKKTTHTHMEVPVELVPSVRKLIKKQKRSA